MFVSAGAIVLAMGWQVGCRPPPPPPSALAPPRLPAEVGCPHSVTVSPANLPVPVRPPADPFQLAVPALLGFNDAAGFHAASHVCDLPDRIVVTAAEQGVQSGKRRIGGTVTTIPRSPTAPRTRPQTIDASSEGCVPGAVTCAWRTSSPEMTKIETVRDQRVPTSGWIHGADDLCRALPDDTLAVCSTATRLAYVELGCAQADVASAPLHLGIHDASLERAFDQDIEVPVARLEAGQGEISGSTYRFRFRRQAGHPGTGPATATVAIDASTLRGTLEIDGASEPCLAFGLYQKPSL